MKSKKSPKVKEIILCDLDTSKDVKAQFKESMILAEAQSFTRNMQTMAPNKCTSTILAKYFSDEFKSSKKVSVKVLTLAEIKKLKKGLLQAGNMGEKDDAR